MPESTYWPAFLSLGLGLYFSLQPMEWGLLFLSMGVVWISEGLNTAMEYLCDKVDPNHCLHIEKVKDISAGAVLLAAGFATLTGLAVFLPKIIVG